MVYSTRPLGTTSSLIIWVEVYVASVTYSPLQREGMQATAVTQTTTVTPATSNSKNDSNIIMTHNSRNASNSRNESNNRTANTVWMPPKAVKPTTAWREANSSRDNRNITASTAEGRPITTRMPEIVETSQQQY